MKKINENDVLIFQIIFLPCPSLLSKYFKQDIIIFSEIYINILLPHFFLHLHMSKFTIIFFLIFTWNMSRIFLFSANFSSEPELLNNNLELSNSFSRLYYIFQLHSLFYPRKLY